MNIWKRLFIVYCILSMGYQYTCCAAEACVDVPSSETEKTIHVIIKVKTLEAMLEDMRKRRADKPKADEESEPRNADDADAHNPFPDFVPSDLCILVLEYAISKPKPVSVYRPNPYATITNYRIPPRKRKRKNLGWDDGCPIL